MGNPRAPHPLCAVSIVHNLYLYLLQYYSDEDEDSDMVSDLEELDVKRDSDTATGIDKTSSCCK